MLTIQLVLIIIAPLVSAQHDVLSFNLGSGMADLSDIDEKHKMEIESYGFDEEILENKISNSYAPWKVILMVSAAGVFVGLLILLVVFGVFQVIKCRQRKASKQKEIEAEQLEEIIVHKSSSEIKT